MKNMKVGLFNEDCIKGDKKYKKMFIKQKMCFTQ